MTTSRWNREELIETLIEHLSRKLNRIIRWNKALDTERGTFHITILQQQTETRSARQLPVELSLFPSEKERQMLQEFVPILSRCIERDACLGLIKWRQWGETIEKGIRSLFDLGEDHCEWDLSTWIVKHKHRLHHSLLLFDLYRPTAVSWRKRRTLLIPSFVCLFARRRRSFSGVHLKNKQRERETNNRLEICTLIDIEDHVKALFMYEIDESEESRAMI